MSRYQKRNKRIISFRSCAYSLLKTTGRIGTITTITTTTITITTTTATATATTTTGNHHKKVRRIHFIY